MSKFVTALILTLCTLSTITVVIMSIIKKDYKQTIEFLVGYSGLLLVFLQSKIAELIIKIF